MNHADAVERMAVEKYLLEKMPASERDEFEEHFFDCRICSADLTATAAFLKDTRQQLSEAPASGTPAAARRAAPRTSTSNSWFGFLWRPAVLSPALAVLLVVVGYQSLVIDPRMKHEVAQLQAPEVLQSVPLTNSRAGGSPTLPGAAGQSFLLPVDIPTMDHYASYACELVAPSGVVIWRLLVGAEQAKNTVSIRVPAGERESGTYTLRVKGYTEAGAGEGVEVTRYRFTLGGPG